MDLSKLLKGFAEVALDEGVRQAKGQIGLHGGGGVVPFAALAEEAFPAARPLGPGQYAVQHPDGQGEGRLLVVRGGGQTVLLHHGTGLRLDRRDPPAGGLAALLRRNAAAGYARWLLVPSGGREEVCCAALLPLAGLTPDTLVAAADAVAFEAGEFAAELGG